MSKVNNQPRMVLGPLKKLTLKLNGNYDKVEALMEERREDRKLKEKLYMYRFILGDTI